MDTNKNNINYQPFLLIGNFLVLIFLIVQET